jgi:lactate 2-monooxygenase
MIGIGRPYGYGLALGGVPGPIPLFRMMLAEVAPQMAVNGYPSVTDVRTNIQRVLKGQV